MIIRINKGLTLTEVVMAIALMLLVGGGIISVIVQSTGLGHTVDYAYVTSNLAKNRIERIREIRKDKGYDYLDEAAETDTVIDRNGNPDPDGDFIRTTIVDTAYATGLTKITVKVKCKIRGVVTPMDTELITLLSQYS